MAKQLPTPSSSLDTKSKQILKRTASAAMEDAHYVHVKKLQIDTKDVKSKQLLKELSTECYVSPPSSPTYTSRSQCPTATYSSSDWPAAPPSPTDLKEKLTLAALTGSVGSGGSPELKHFITTVTINPVVTTAATLPTSLNAISQGDAFSSRTGRQVRNKYLTMHGIVDFGVYALTTITGAAQRNGVRVIVCWDKMPIGSSGFMSQDAAPPVSTTAVIFTNGASTIVGSFAVYNPVTHGTRYKILFDKTYTNKDGTDFQNSTPQWAQSSSHDIYERIDLKDVTTEFTADTGTSHVTNGLTLWVGSDISSAGNSQPYFAMNFDLRFTDA